MTRLRRVVMRFLVSLVSQLKSQSFLMLIRCDTLLDLIFMVSWCLYEVAAWLPKEVHVEW
jgi:hypothetical protein